ncbi:hypothetical protein [Nonomuraea sp. NPDC049400]|uniref:hypothetical protein n=1 Tax=Nonomuraea sp. NPDC049400 TaxID=3364352 RepID=UPI003788CABC
MKLRLIIEADYEVTDDLAERERVYGTSNPAECAKVDEGNNPIELLEFARERGSITHHRVRILDEYSTPGDPRELDEHDLITAVGVHDQDCPCAYCDEWKKRRAVAFARWIVSLDDPDGPGYEARRSVTMGQIIGKAREALALPEE